MSKPIPTSEHILLCMMSIGTNHGHNDLILFQIFALIFVLVVNLDLTVSLMGYCWCIDFCKSFTTYVKYLRSIRTRSWELLLFSNLIQWVTCKKGTAYVNLRIVYLEVDQIHKEPCQPIVVQELPYSVLLPPNEQCLPWPSRHLVFELQL